MDISQCIAPDGVVLGLEVSSKAELLRFLADETARRRGLQSNVVLTALQKREALGSTGIGAGIGLPHAPVEGVQSPFGLFARLVRPIDFEAVDEEPVDLVCVVLTPPGGSQIHLTLLSRIARQLRSSGTVVAIRNAKTAAALHAALTENQNIDSGAS